MAERANLHEDFEGFEDFEEFELDDDHVGDGWFTAYANWILHSYDE